MRHIGWTWLPVSYKNMPCILNSPGCHCQLLSKVYLCPSKSIIKSAFCYLPAHQPGCLTLLVPRNTLAFSVCLFLMLVFKWQPCQVLWLSLLSVLGIFPISSLTDFIIKIDVFHYLYYICLKFWHCGYPWGMLQSPEFCPMWMENHEATEQKKIKGLPLNIIRSNNKMKFYRCNCWSNF